MAFAYYDQLSGHLFCTWLFAAPMTARRHAGGDFQNDWAVRHCSREPQPPAGVSLGGARTVHLPA